MQEETRLNLPNIDQYILMQIADDNDSNGVLNGRIIEKGGTKEHPAQYSPSLFQTAIPVFFAPCAAVHII